MQAQHIGHLLVKFVERIKKKTKEKLLLQHIRFLADYSNFSQSWIEKHEIVSHFARQPHGNSIAATYARTNVKDACNIQKRARRHKHTHV